MGQKEKLILFLINADRGIKGIYGLVRHFDRANFPGEVGKSIDQLLKLKYVVVTGHFDNGTRAEFEATEAGREYLRKEFNKEEILRYIATFDNPELTYLYVTKND